MENVHRAFTLTGVLCLSGACKVKDTIPYELSNQKHESVIIGQPSGLNETFVDFEYNNLEINIKALKLYRTARFLMSGDFFI